MVRRRLLRGRSEEHTSELQSRLHLVCRLLLEKKPETVRVSPPDAGPWRSQGGRADSSGGRGRRSGAGRTEARTRQASGLPHSALFFNDTATTEIYTLSLHDALPI